MLTATIRTDDGQAVGILVLKNKVFKSGREGWFGQGKIEMNGVRFQAQAQLVAIAAKPKSEAAETGAVEDEA